MESPVECIQSGTNRLHAERGISRINNPTNGASVAVARMRRSEDSTCEIQMIRDLNSATSSYGRRKDSVRKSLNYETREKDADLLRSQSRLENRERRTAKVLLWPCDNQWGSINCYRDRLRLFGL